MFKDPPQEWLTNEDKKDFRIRFDIMVKHDLWSTANWKEHPATLTMASMLPKKDIEELFQEVIENEPMVEINMIELRELMRLSKSDDLAIKEPNRKLIRDYLNENRWAGAGNNTFDFYYVYEGRYFGMNLNKPIEVVKEHENFPLLFSFRLSKTDYPSNFLAYHLNETFKEDRKKYKLFIREIQDKYSDFLSSMERFINQWVDDELHQIVEKTEINAIMAAYMVKFLHEANGKLHIELFKEIAGTYPSINIKSLKTMFYRSINKSDLVYHEKHRKQIKASIEILKENDIKAHRIATKFLQSI